jgi:hypothetical protein
VQTLAKLRGLPPFANMRVKLFLLIPHYFYLRVSYCLQRSQATFIITSDQSINRPTQVFHAAAAPRRSRRRCPRRHAIPGDFIPFILAHNFAAMGLPLAQLLPQLDPATLAPREDVAEHFTSIAELVGFGADRFQEVNPDMPRHEACSLARNVTQLREPNWDAKLDTVQQLLIKLLTFVMVVGGLLFRLFLHVAMLWLNGHNVYQTLLRSYLIQ